MPGRVTSFELIEDTPKTNTRQVFGVFFSMIVVYAVFSFFRVGTQNIIEFIKLAFVFGGFIALLFAFVNLEMATVGLVFIVPIVNQSMPGLNFYFTYGDAYLLILTFALLMRMIVKRTEVLRGSFLDRPMYFYVLASIFTALVSPYMDEAFKEIVQTLEYFVFASLLYQTVIKNKEELDTLVLQLALSSILISSYGIVQYFQYGGGSTRVPSTFSHFNPFGAYLALLIPFFFNMFVSEKIPWRKWLVFGSALGLNSMAILFTFSRGAWIGVLGGLVFSGWIRGMGQFIRILTIIVLLIVTASLFLPARFIGRATSITEINDESTQSRFDQYRMAREIISNRPLTGVGPGGLFYYAYDKGKPHLGEVHNLPLYIAAERGIPALLILAWLFVAFFKNMFKKTANTRYQYFKTFYIGAMASMVSFLIVNMTAFHLVRGIGIMFGIFLGMSVAATRIEEGVEEAGGEFEEEPDLAFFSREPNLLIDLPPRGTYY